MAKFKINIELTGDAENQNISLERENEDSCVTFFELFTGFLDATKGLGYIPPEEFEELRDNF